MEVVSLRLAIHGHDGPHLQKVQPPWLEEQQALLARFFFRSFGTQGLFVNALPFGRPALGSAVAVLT